MSKKKQSNKVTNKNNKVTDRNTNRVTDRCDKCSKVTNKNSNEIGFDSENDCR